VKAAKLDWMGVFEYSDVDNAESYALDEKVDAEAITDRRNRLMAIQKKISRENLRAKYLRPKSRKSEARMFTALIEGPSKDNPLCGKRGWNAWLPRLTASCISRYRAAEWRCGRRWRCCAS